MLSLALYLIAGILIVLLPVVAVAKYLEWRAWDTDRRVARLRERRSGTYSREFKQLTGALRSPRDSGKPQA